ncbi:monovalent cation/H+ antiporter complex subunit F [Corynebacterium rhinophilum]|uniref:monovalent cation/H+ antiporter complex subunit F n=1 Tax=Corynebacterium rhinophilum TaxID=3050197 RepID=UPI00254F3D3E|nr:monovalent cation/H+ antiporter complex subunit F [Corynebacterium sp. MSK107]MDK8702692.1 monovalent cation/H+ antiporter complex subunit F [Corynebacterium sp. MSK107]
MDPQIYHAILLVPAFLLWVSVLITVWRIITGPNSLDRLVGMDGFTAMFQCALATYMCWSIDTSVVSAMLVIALLGFISTVSVTRFRKRDNQ